MEPAKAARIISHEPSCTENCRDATITNATISFAPDETPSVNGVAIGLWKKVCSRYPDNARAPPKITAANALGARTCVTISV